MSLDDLTPTFPGNAHDWAGLALVLALALFKLDRGTTMYRRSQFIDRFGASVIVFDLAFAAAFLASAVGALYPQIGGSAELYWSSLILIFVAMAWQWIEVRIAAGHRIEVAMSGTTATDQPWKEGDPDRRSGVDRRRPTSDIYDRRTER